MRPKPSVSLPGYFYEDRRYQSVSRYPSGGRGLVIPASFLVDLDRSFRELIELVPFQHNTELRRYSAASNRCLRLQLTARNTQAAALRRFLRVRRGAR